MKEKSYEILWSLTEEYAARTNQRVYPMLMGPDYDTFAEALQMAHNMIAEADEGALVLRIVKVRRTTASNDLTVAPRDHVYSGDMPCLVRRKGADAQALTHEHDDDCVCRPEE